MKRILYFIVGLVCVSLSAVVYANYSSEKADEDSYMNYVKRLEDVSMLDVAIVGGKNASLGEMIANLSAQGVRVPSGFAITADAYRAYLSANNLGNQLEALLAGISNNDVVQLATQGKKIRALFEQTSLPNNVVAAITASYQAMEKEYGEHCLVAVRSSATAEDLPQASFAGQQETFLCVSGIEQILHACVKAYASLFTDRAISYRIDQGFDHLDVALSIGIQKMVRSDQACSGVLFTLDTESGHPDVILLSSSYGLGELVVQGAVNPDQCYVHKPTLKQGFRPILKKTVGSKEQFLSYTDTGTLVQKETAPELRQQFSLSDDEILELSRQALIIEDHYSALRGRWSPMDIEWAKDGMDGKLYIVQARPETVHARQQEHTIKLYKLHKKPEHHILVSGQSVGKGIAVGPARLITSASEMYRVQPGDILVTDMTDPDWEPVMRKAAGIVTNRGGRTCHAAIVSRELGIPAIVGTHDGTKRITEGSDVTIDCSSGDTGSVYNGRVPFEVEEISIDQSKKPNVGIMVNIGTPDEALNWASLPVDGVGLARLEFIVATSIKIHPMALVHFDRVTNPQVKQQITDMTSLYAQTKDFFVQTLAQHVGMIAAAFYPRPVIVRMSDFKSNEYAQLIGGADFESLEENPMIGFRGASRYDHPHYRDAFALECAAMRMVREVMGLTNVKLMIPFTRTMQEGKRVVQLMAEHGLKQGDHGLEIYMMCEVPSNAICLDQFAQVFDGFSIGSNDLTQLTLAVDRDSAILSGLFDERDEAVKRMMTMAITAARQAGKPIGICGQAPSDYPEIALWLYQQGISSISLNPGDALPVMKFLMSQQ